MFENVDSGVANTGGSRNRVTNPGGSRIGFRGTEAIGGGTSAFFQIESNIGGVDGTTTGSWGLGSRNTGVGLQAALMLGDGRHGLKGGAKMHTWPGPPTKNPGYDATAPALARTGCAGSLGP